jgi:hypothetical protein
MTAGVESPEMTGFTVRGLPRQGIRSESRNGESESRLEKLRIRVAAGPQKNAEETPLGRLPNWFSQGRWEYCEKWRRRSASASVVEADRTSESLGVETRAE